MKYSDREAQRGRYRPRKILIVDGYNVINAWQRLKKISREDLKSSRDELISNIMEYSKIKGYEPYIVFDAYNVKGVDEKIEKINGVTVVYTREKQTADSYIEKFISTLSKYDEVSVVTSDYAEQQIALGKGAIRIPSRELIEDFNRFKTELRKSKGLYKKSGGINRLEDVLDRDMYEKLEKIRRKR